MLDLGVLDIGLGIIFLYLIFSLACTAATEMLGAIVRLRARTLENGIAYLLRDPGMKDKLIGHPLIHALYREGKKPSYIPPRTFALSLLNILSESRGLPGLEELRGEVEKLPEDSELRKSLSIIMDEAGKDMKAIQKGIETWYNDTMDRVAGWYKTKAQVITFCVAVVIAVGANADSIQWVKSLSNDAGIREVLVAQAQAYARQSEPAGTVLNADTSQAGVSEKKNTPSTIDTLNAAANQLRQNLNEIKQLGVPLGWQTLPKDGEWISKIFGLLLTILAMSFGAPFWFDMLKKSVNIRSSGTLTGSNEEKKTT